MPYGVMPLPLSSEAQVQQILRAWPLSAMKAARHIIRRYGWPHETTAAALVWHYNNPWERTVVWRDGAHHAWPVAHLDVVEQTIAYRVPAQKVAELADFSTKLSVHRTRREISVCCQNEGMNFLWLNLAHEIILGLLTPSQARQRLREILNGKRLHWPEQFMDGLQFEIVRNGYGVDESTEQERTSTTAVAQV